MCIICVKPKGVDMPPSTWIENMWYANSDGAGFMYADGKKVTIRKGYMSLQTFKDALTDVGDLAKLKELPLVMHFRIGTAGGNIPANTHPFPISDSIPMLQKLMCTTQLGIVHNGIIPITPRQQNISDTMEYIASQLAPLYRYDNEFYRSKDLLQMIGNATSSKLAFLTAKGEIFTVGSFVEEKGLLFSNTTYQSGYFYRRQPVKAYGLSDREADLLYGDWYYNLEQGEYIMDLMPLDDGSYVVDMETGDFYEADDYSFFIDDAGFLYIYDDYMQCCMEVDGEFGVYNKHGNTFRFKKEEAAQMLIIDESVTMQDYINLYTGAPEPEKVDFKVGDKVIHDKRGEGEVTVVDDKSICVRLKDDPVLLSTTAEHLKHKEQKDDQPF